MNKKVIAQKTVRVSHEYTYICSIRQKVRIKLKKTTLNKILTITKLNLYVKLVEGTSND